MSHSILVRQYLSLRDQSVANCTLLFSVTVGTAGVNSGGLAVFQYDSVRVWEWQDYLRLNLSSLLFLYQWP